MPAPSKFTATAVSNVPFKLLDKISEEYLHSVLPGLQQIDVKHTLIHTCGTWRAVIFDQGKAHKGHLSFPSVSFANFLAKFWTTLFLMQEALRVHQLLDVTVDTGDVDLTWTTTAAEKHPWVVETLIALGDAAEWFRNLSVMTSGQPSLALILRVVRVEQAMNLEHIRVALNRERFLHLSAPLVAVPSLHLTSFTIDTVIFVWEDTVFIFNVKFLSAERGIKIGVVRLGGPRFVRRIAAIDASMEVCSKNIFHQTWWDIRKERGTIFVDCKGQIFMYRSYRADWLMERCEKVQIAIDVLVGDGRTAQRQEECRDLDYSP
ncbi:hypothetical protein R3P38DRAFT_2779212 [Favolaschia claudopus]|uniref:F-box protein n=1 Tax=Favolaschia claudopus TaxID=2862362 RepID=A0AAW0BBY6_9AGAR